MPDPLPSGQSRKPRPVTLYVCNGCGRRAEWTGRRMMCGACGSTRRRTWHFVPTTAQTASPSSRTETQ